MPHVRPNAALQLPKRPEGHFSDPSPVAEKHADGLSKERSHHAAAAVRVSRSKNVPAA
jgi:hypothetical protein